LGMEEDVPIEHSLVNRAIENAQKKVEGHHFDMRKNLLEYDDVMNQQRKSIYSLRRQILEGRYQPELSDEDKKKGKTPPPPPSESGKWTAKIFADTIRPQIEKLIDSFAEKALGTATNGDARDLARHLEALQHELYRYYGALVDLKKTRGDRDLCVKEGAEQC